MTTAILYALLCNLLHAIGYALAKLLAGGLLIALGGLLLLPRPRHPAG